MTEIRVCESPDCTRNTPEPSLEYCSGHRVLLPPARVSVSGGPGSEGDAQVGV